MMKKSILVAIMFALIFFLETESVRGQALEDVEQAEIAKALPQSEFFQEEASAASDSDGVPIAIGVESDNGRLNQGSEVIELVQNFADDRARAETKEDGVPDDTVGGEWDPWESFNEKTFWFNRQVDRFVLKPAAKAYNAALPNLVRGGIANMFDNLDVTRRLVNNILQLRFDGAGRELARFVINSTVGVAGLFDVAGHLDITKSDRDTGQTLGIYGIAHGPYLVLPFLPPLTVRDFFGFVADEAMYPLSYFIPIGANIGMTAVETISDRAATIDRYQGVEDTVVVLYGSVRDAYFQRRAADLKK